MNENLYKDFIEAVRQEGEVGKGIISELKYANSRMDEFLAMQRKNLDYLEQRSDRLNQLFKAICAANEWGAAMAIIKNATDDETTIIVGQDGRTGKKGVSFFLQIESSKIKVLIDNITRDSIISLRDAMSDALSWPPESP